MQVSKMKKEDLVKEVTNLRDRLSERDATIAELNQSIKEKLGLIEELKDKISQQGRTIEDFEASIKTTQELNTKIKEELVTATEDLQSARKQVVALNDDARGMERAICNLHATNNKLKVWKYVAIGAIIAFLIALCVIVA